MALKTLKTPVTANELVKDINDNIAELDSTKADASDLSNYIPTSQKGASGGVATLDSSGKVNETAKAADVAKDYDAATGTIKTKIDSIDTEISNIKNGNTTVGKAKSLNPDAEPGNSKYYGTSPSGTVGWHDLPSPGGDGVDLCAEAFTASDARWGTAVSGIYSLTFAHNGYYPIDVYKNGGALYERVSVDVQRDNANVIVRAMEKFDGYVVMAGYPPADL